MILNPFVNPKIKQIHHGLLLIEDYSNEHNNVYTLELFKPNNGPLQHMRLSCQKNPFYLQIPDNVHILIFHNFNFIF